MRWDERGDEVWLEVELGDTACVEDVVREFDAAGYCDLDVDAVERALATGEPAAVARSAAVPAPSTSWWTPPGAQPRS